MCWFKHLFKLGARFSLGRGDRVQFWLDWWLGDGPLAERFPRLFQISSDPTMLVSQAFEDGNWNVNFRRSFDHDDMVLWNSLKEELLSTRPSQGLDVMTWSLEPSGKFSVSSLYRRLNQGSASLASDLIWKGRIPTKVKIFLWQLERGRLPSSAQINRRHGPSDGRCVLCGSLETVSHIFFACSLASFIGTGFREDFGVNWNPASFDDFFALLASLHGKAKRAIWLWFAAQSWALWHIRNKFTIEGRFPRQPADCFFKTSIFLQQWRPLIRSRH